MSRQTQRFSGKTLETAVLAAINELGDDAEILDARRVRRGGLAGFFASEHYVVTARPSSRRATATAAAPAAGPLPVAAAQRAPEPTADFEQHLRALVDAVEVQEEAAERVRPADIPRDAVVAPRPRPVRMSSVPRFFTDEDLVRLDAPAEQPVAEPVLVGASAPAAAMGAGATMQGGTPAPPVVPSAPAAGGSRPAPVPSGRNVRPWHPEGPQPVPSSPRLPGTPPAGDGRQVIDLRAGIAASTPGQAGPAWSVENLRQLGVPEPILARLPEGLSGDVEWTQALEAAIRSMVPPPPDPWSAAGALTVNGAGAAAVPRLLHAALTGYPLGELQLADRRVPATAFEMTLAIRSCLL